MKTLIQRFPLVLALKEFRAINVARSNRFHQGGLNEWTALEWAGAMTGEAGECANACKKLRRMELNAHSVNNYANMGVAIRKIASEAAGTFIYLDLLCARLGIDLGQAIVEEFNYVSAREGFPEIL